MKLEDIDRDVAIGRTDTLPYLLRSAGLVSLAGYIEAQQAEIERLEDDMGYMVTDSVVEDNYTHNDTIDSDYINRDTAADKVGELIEQVWYEKLPIKGKHRELSKKDMTALVEAITYILMRE